MPEDEEDGDDLAEQLSRTPRPSRGTRKPPRACAAALSKAACSKPKRKKSHTSVATQNPDGADREVEEILGDEPEDAVVAMNRTVSAADEEEEETAEHKRCLGKLTREDCVITVLATVACVVMVLLLAWIKYVLEQPSPEWLANIGP